MGCVQGNTTLKISEDEWTRTRASSWVNLWNVKLNKKRKSQKNEHGMIARRYCSESSKLHGVGRGTYKGG